MAAFSNALLLACLLVLLAAFASAANTQDVINVSRKLLSAPAPGPASYMTLVSQWS